MKLTHNGTREAQSKEAEFFLFGRRNIGGRSLKSALAYGASLQKIYCGTDPSLEEDVDGSIGFPMWIR
jgi:hypothetical protein